MIPFTTNGKALSVDRYMVIAAIVCDSCDKAIEAGSATVPMDRGVLMKLFPERKLESEENLIRVEPKQLRSLLQKKFNLVREDKLSEILGGMFNR